MSFHENLNIFERVSKLICQDLAELNELVKNFRFILVYFARKQFPDLSNEELALETGLPNKVINEHLQEIEPVKIISRESMILAELWRQKDENGVINMSGENSFASIVESITGDGDFPASVLNTLHQSGAIECHSILDKTLLIKSEFLTTEKVFKDALVYINSAFDKFAETALDDYDLSESEKLEDAGYQRTKRKIKDMKGIQKYFQLLLCLFDIFPELDSVFQNHDMDKMTGAHLNSVLTEFTDTNNTKH